MTAMEKASNAIRSARRCMVFSGAGMSKDSGIDTFRGGKGLWNGLFGNIVLLYAGVPFGWNFTPGLVWRLFISNFYAPIAGATPHEGYYALNRLREARFSGLKCFHVATMNVDGFHQDSGVPESNVFEVHGTVRKFCCIQCRTSINIPDPIAVASNPPRCECGGHPRPAATLFTESLPQKAWNGVETAVNQMTKGDVMLVVGTSSVVYPAAYIPQYASDRGVTIIEVNPDENTPIESLVDIKLKGTALDVLPELLKHVVA